MIGNALFHFISCYTGFAKPHSQSTAKEQEIIKKYAAGRHCAVEIGVYEGVNTVNIAAVIAEHGMLYAIDPFFKGKLGVCYYEQIAKRQVGKSGYARKIKFVEGLSESVADQVPSDIDFIFVDGDHSIDGIKKDWAIYSAKMKSGGLILLHDTRVPAHDPGVAQLGSHIYFESHIKQDSGFEVIDFVDSLTVLKKK